MASLWSNPIAFFEPIRFARESRGHNDQAADVLERIRDHRARRNLQRKKIYLSRELQLISGYGTHLARIDLAYFLSSAYNIVINGGGFYELERKRGIKHGWVCKGEQETFQIVDHGKRNFSISQGDVTIAEFSKSCFGHQYAVHANEGANVTLVVSMVLALSMSEDRDATWVAM